MPSPSSLFASYQWYQLSWALGCIVLLITNIILQLCVLTVAKRNVSTKCITEIWQSKLWLFKVVFGIRRKFLLAAWAYKCDIMRDLPVTWSYQHDPDRGQLLICKSHFGFEQINDKLEYPGTAIMRNQELTPGVWAYNQILVVLITPWVLMYWPL